MALPTPPFQCRLRLHCPALGICKLQGEQGVGKAIRPGNFDCLFLVEYFGERKEERLLNKK